MPEEFEEQPAEKPDWIDYLALGRRRRWYFLLPLFTGWLVVWAVSWVLPAVYRSGTLILVEQPTVPQQYVVPNVASNLQDRLQSITQQILSRTRLLHIIDTLNLYPKEHRLSPDELVDRMRKDIEIELVHAQERDQLTAFNIYYSSDNPQVAQQVTRELTNFFISENLEARQQQSEDTTKFLENQLEAARRTLSEQEKRVREYKDRYLGELPGQLQSNLQILSGLQTQLQAEEDALGRAKQQNAYLESLLTQYQTVERSLKAGDNTAAGLPALDQELEKLKTQLADLSSHYTDRHPDVRKLKEQIAKTEQLQQQIATDLKTKAADSQSEDNSNVDARDYASRREGSSMMEIKSQLKANQIETANRQHAIQELEGKLSEYQARLNQTPVREQQLADLSRDYDQSRVNYESLLAKRNQSELATNLERRQQGEHFRILDPPSLPTKPYSPNRFKLSYIGLFAGLVLGAGCAAGAEFIDDRIYGEKELKKVLPLPVLADVPPLMTLEEERTYRKKLWLGWVSAGLMLTSIIVGSALSYVRG